MRIGIARIWQETNTFSPEQTTPEHFRLNGLYFGKEVLDHLDELPELTGAVEAAKARADIELVPLIAAMAWPGGRLTKEAFEYLKRSLLEGLHQCGDLDGLYLSGHGALSALDCDDVEGDLLVELRREHPEKLPIAISLDMHANITRLMMDSVDITVGYHTCPHLDLEETGHRAMELLIAMVYGKTHPVMAWSKVPMVVPADRHNHSEGPLQELLAYVEKAEKMPEVISCSVFAVQPWLDVEELGWSTVVITDGDAELAQKLADEIAQRCWQLREDFIVDKLLPEKAVEKALRISGRPVVISDSADATNSGAPGNSTWILKELIKAKVTEPVFLTMVAPEASKAAHRAGIGETIEVEFGTKPANPFSESLTMLVRVVSLPDGKICLSGHLGKSSVCRMGKTAVLAADEIRIITSEAPGPGHVPPEFFQQLGLDIEEAKIIVAKSPVGFRADYEPIAAGIILCESPGPACSDLRSLDYTRRPRPLYPFEQDLQWSARN
ncbi:MAG: hypothetical protein GWP14_02395 [Actinobacteria bacterium]|nr:hypothetical protein [Actinomycetota bacterium]